MGDIVCDECGTQPYVAPGVEDDIQAKLWCDCPDSVPIVIKNKPEYWDEAGHKFVCYQCGEEPVITTSVTVSRPHPKTQYNLSCRCNHPIGLTRIGWRGIHPDKWKDDMDPTKWPDKKDEIVDAIEEHGPLEYDSEIAEYVDLEEDGIRCLRIHMMREGVIKDIDGRFVTGDMYVGLQNEKDDESGENTGKESVGFFEGFISMFR